MIPSLFRKAIVPVLWLTAAALVLLLITPRAVHALVATLVQVANTTANPAITQDTSKQASQTVTLSCPIYILPALACYSIDQHGIFSFPTQYVVPSSANFVVTGMDYVPLGVGTSSAILAIYDNGTTGSGYEEIKLANANNQGQIMFPTGIVLGAGVTPRVSFVGPSTQIPLVTLHGYLTSN